MTDVSVEAVVVIGEGEAEVAVEQLHLRRVGNLLLLAERPAWYYDVRLSMVHDEVLCVEQNAEAGGRIDRRRRDDDLLHVCFLWPARSDGSG